MQCDNDAARTAVIAVFAQVDSLPDAEHQLAILDGDAERCAEECRLDVGRHVVRSLRRVAVRKRFRRDSAQRHFQVAGHIRVGILVDDQRRRSVLQEGVQQSHTQCAERFRDAAHQFLGDQMEAPAAGRELDHGLMPVGRHGAVRSDFA